MRLIFEALDVLFFRDARAFGAGADHVADSVLPPHATTIQGAIRTWLGWQLGWRPGNPLPEELGNENGLGQLRVRGPFVGRVTNGSIVTRHPLPADSCSFEQQNQGGSATIVITQRKPIFSTSPQAAWLKSDLSSQAFSAPLMWPAPPSQDARKIDPPQGLEIDFLITYLLGKTVQLTESQYLELQGFGLGLAQKEPRIGIGLNTAQRTARQGLFYTARFARLKEDPRAVLVADLVGGDLSALQNRGEDVLLLGGESRLARFRVAEEYDWHVDKFIEALAGLDKFKLYALTPLPLGSAAGEVFDGLSGNGPYLGGRKIKVTAAATGRPVRISGFDVKNGRPRKSLLAWPPGSVFYIQLEDGPCDDEFVRRVHGQSLLRPGSWEEQIGLGQVLLGKLFEDSV